MKEQFEWHLLIAILGLNMELIPAYQTKLLVSLHSGCVWPLKASGLAVA